MLRRNNGSVASSILSSVNAFWSEVPFTDRFLSVDKKVASLGVELVCFENVDSKTVVGSENFGVQGPGTQVGSVEERSLYRGNEVPMVGLGMIKQSTASVLEVANGAKAEMARLQRATPL